MIEKITPPIKFDKEHKYIVVARDGEKFYVANEEIVASDPHMDLLEMGSRPLLQWALEVEYPLKKFISLQKLLSKKFLG